jgi:hypothetical protein
MGSAWRCPILKLHPICSISLFVGSLHPSPCSQDLLSSLAGKHAPAAPTQADMPPASPPCALSLTCPLPLPCRLQTQPSQLHSARLRRSTPLPPDTHAYTLQQVDLTLTLTLVQGGC